MAQKRAHFIPNGSSALQEKFINYLMKGGKKSVARAIFQDMLAYIDEKIKKDKKDPQEVFALAIQNIKPSVEVRAKRVGGSVYQVPIEVAPKRQQTLAIRWVVQACRKMKGKPMHQRLGQEIMDAAELNGAAFKKKEEVHRMAQANKAFAHMANY